MTKKMRRSFHGQLRRMGQVTNQFNNLSLTKTQDGRLNWIQRLVNLPKWKNKELIIDSVEFLWIRYFILFPGFSSFYSSRRILVPPNIFLTATDWIKRTGLTTRSGPEDMVAVWETEKKSPSQKRKCSKYVQFFPFLCILPSPYAATTPVPSPFHKQGPTLHGSLTLPSLLSTEPTNRQQHHQSKFGRFINTRIYTGLAAALLLRTNQFNFQQQAAATQSLGKI